MISISEIGVWVAFALTVMVYSYLFFDSFLYRIAVYIFAGLTAGLVAIVTYNSTIRPWLTAVQESGGGVAVLIGLLPFFLAFFLLMPSWVPVFGLLRRLTLAFLIGVGAAVTVVGTISGTLVPLTLLAGQSVRNNLVIGIITIVGVISTLIYFQYMARHRADGENQQNILVQSLGRIGGYFMAITFGTIYAAAIATSLTIFSESVGFLIEQIRGFFGS